MPVEHTFDLGLIKPMLAFQRLPTLLKFPMYISPKLDGIRASMQNGKLMSRSLKPIPNVNIQTLFKSLPDGLDGELIVGDPAKDPYRRTVSLVMSDNKPITETVGFYVFDYFGSFGSYIGTSPFRIRYKRMLSEIDRLSGESCVTAVPQVFIETVEAMDECEKLFLEHGYEGAILRSPTGPYKQGRSTENEGYLLKLKRFEDAEARIVGVSPEMENQNVAFTNELGRTARSSAQAGKVAKDTLGKLHCIGVGGRYDNIEFDVAVSSLTHVQRKFLWDTRDDLINDMIVYKFFPLGGDTRPRHPMFKGFRDVRDI